MLDNIDCNVWLSELHHSVNWSYCQWIQFQMQKPTLLIHKLKLTILDSQLPQMWKTSPGDSKQGRPSNSLAFVSKGTFTSVCNTTATVAVAEWKSAQESGRVIWSKWASQTGKARQACWKFTSFCNWIAGVMMIALFIDCPTNSRLLQTELTIFFPFFLGGGRLNFNLAKFHLNAYFFLGCP